MIYLNEYHVDKKYFNYLEIKTKIKLLSALSSIQLISYNFKEKIYSYHIMKSNI